MTRLHLIANQYYTYYLIAFCMLLFFLSNSCTYENRSGKTSINLSATSLEKEKIWAYEGITGLLKGDILVKPNVNLLPGSAFIEYGWG